MNTPTRKLGRIMQDIDPESPRDWGNQGTMVCWHGRYNLGDEQPNEPPDEWLAKNKPEVYLPLYLYDHSGITMNTTGFGCRWDSGQVGFIVANLDQIKEEHGWKRLSDKRREKILEWLEADVEVYDQYLRGDVYGFDVVEQKLLDAGWVDWDIIDSCWGFYGDDPETNGMSDHVDDDVEWEIDT